MLWHMKKEVEVSYLAQEAIAQDRRSPHAWAIMGNCFSLQKVCLPFKVSLLKGICALLLQCASSCESTVNRCFCRLSCYFRTIGPPNKRHVRPIMPYFHTVILN